MLVAWILDILHEIDYIARGYAEGVSFSDYIIDNFRKIICSVSAILNG